MCDICSINKTELKPLRDPIYVPAQERIVQPYIKAVDLEMKTSPLNMREVFKPSIQVESIKLDQQLRIMESPIMLSSEQELRLIEQINKPVSKSTGINNYINLPKSNFSNGSSDSSTQFMQRSNYNSPTADFVKSVTDGYKRQNSLNEQRRMDNNSYNNYRQSESLNNLQRNKYK